jgi:hypothetical protein
MRLVLGMSLLVVVAIAVAGCGGGGGGTNEVSGCKIEPNTVCQNTDFTDADLSDEDLTGANLTGSNFTDANLSGANLTEANLSNSQIVDAKLDDANLTRTNLTGATIENTDLSGTTRCGTIRTNGTTDDTDCPASGGTTTTATTTANANLPTIVSFDGPATVKCPQGRTQVTVNLSWSTRKATELAWTVDGQMIDGPTEPSGSGPFAFSCDSPEHTYGLKASNDKGQYATFSVTVQRAQ